MKSNRPFPRGLYGLCDDAVRPDLPLSRQAELLLEAGVKLLQLRFKRTPVRAALSECRAAVERCRAQGALCLVNDRVDWALLCGADGVHLGEEDVEAKDARALLGPNRLIGVTARDALGVRAAHAAGADYAGVGPVFASSTKRLEVALLGLDGLSEVVRQSPIPVVAISGIGLGNVEGVARAGAAMAAVASDVLCAQDPVARARALQSRFEAAMTRRTL